MTELIISSSTLIVVVLLLRRFLKGKVSLRLQYAIWGLVLLRLLIPFHLLESPLSVLNVFRTGQPAAPSVPLHQYDAQAPIYDEPADNAPAIGRTPADDAPAVPAASAHWNWDRLLHLVWYTGIAGVGLCLLLSNLDFARKLRRASRLLPVEGYKLKVYVVKNLPAPCLYGLLTPSVYITPEVAADKTRLSHVLTHELCHYRHGDHIWSVIRAFCLALYWFNPLVWLAAAASHRDAELACDEATIALLGEASRTAYGQTLIGLTCQKRSAMELICCAAMANTKKGIVERITLIAKKPKTAISTLVVLLLVLATAVGCAFTGAQPGGKASPSIDENAAADASVNSMKIYDGNNPLSKEELQKATQLTIVNVDNLDFLRDATNLTHLAPGSDAQSVSGDIGALSGLTKLTHLQLGNTNVTGDLSALNQLKNLQELELQDTNVMGDLSALTGLSQLKTLSLYSDKITGSLSALSGLKDLEIISLKGRISGDLGALSGLPKLYQLFLYNTPNITGNISALGGMANLEIVSLNSSGITGDLGALGSLPKLYRLFLSNAPGVTGDISALKGSKLREISIVETGVTAKLRDLVDFEYLSYITLTNTSGDISALANMDYLHSIILFGGDITGDIGALGRLPKLDTLILRDAPNVTGDLEALTGLRLLSLMLNGTNVKVDLSTVAQFEVLSYIELVSPQVSGDVGTLEKLKFLRYVTVDSPNITGDVSAFTRHINITQLCLSSPRITGDISSLSNLYNLQHLDLHDTGVTGNLNALCGLEKLNQTNFTNTGVTARMTPSGG